MASSDSRPVFREVQRFPLRRIGLAIAIPPCCMLGLLIWQVILGHPWGTQPMSKANVIGWTVFLWLIYLRLITVRLVTEVRKGELVVRMRGLWRSRRVPLDRIQLVETITHDIARDYGGYGIRSTREGKAYVAGGGRGVRVTLDKEEKLVVVATAGRTGGRTLGLGYSPALQREINLGIVEDVVLVLFLQLDVCRRQL